MKPEGRLRTGKTVRIRRAPQGLEGASKPGDRQAVYDCNRLVIQLVSRSLGAFQSRRWRATLACWAPQSMKPEILEGASEP